MQGWDARRGRAWIVARGHVVVLLGYLLTAVALTWPLVTRFASHVPGDGIDDPALAWNLWWIKARLVDQAAPNIFHSGWMFFPVEINLGFYTLTPLSGLLSIPLQVAFNPVVATNLLLLSTFVVGGYGAFLLTRAVWRLELAALSPAVAWGIAWMAGAMYAFASAKLFYVALGQFNIAGSHWLPFAALFLWRVTQTSTLRRAVVAGALAGLFTVLQAWTELTYASFLIIFAALLTIWWLAVGQGWPARRRLLVGMVVTAAVFGVGIAPFLAAMIPDLVAEGDFFASGGGFADVFSADLMGFFAPTRLHPWLGAWVAGLPFPNDKGQQLYLGYSLMALIAIAAVTTWRTARNGLRRRAGFWLLALVGFGWLSLGPALRWAGQELPIPGPFELVSRLPFFSGNRYPSRYSVVLLLCAVVLAGYAMSTLATRLRGRQAGVVLALVAGLFTFEHLSVPLPLNDFRIPAVYARIAQTPGDFAVLELPTGWRNGARVMGRSDVLIMMQQWYQTGHGKRRLGGNTSRNPAFKFQYFSDEPLLADLIALMNADRDHLGPVLAQRYPAMVARARDDAASLLAFLNVRYVTLHVDRSPDLLVRYVEEALPLTLVETWQGEDWSGAPSTIRLYAVQTDSPAPSRVLDLAEPGAARRHLAEGWAALAASGRGRFATRAEPTLLMALAQDQRVLRLAYGRETRVEYRLDGRRLGEANGLEHALVIPADAARPPVSRLQLRFLDAPLPAAQVSAAPSVIGSTGASLAPGVALVVRSAGEEVGDFAQLMVNGTEYAGDARGYHLAALTPHGRVLAAAVFDTFTEGSADALAAWLGQWPDGTVIAGAVADEASYHLNQAAVDALAHVGVVNDLRGHFRWSHAFVGVVGAAPGSAVEALSLVQPASVWLGAPADGPLLYGPLLTVSVE